VTARGDAWATPDAGEAAVQARRFRSRIGRRQIANSLCDLATKGHAINKWQCVIPESISNVIYVTFR
jgi:hypothetical protein